MTHELKCERRWWLEIVRGGKRAEVRRHDRDYQVGDSLILRETVKGHHTGRAIRCYISNILTHERFPTGIQPGFSVLSIEGVSTLPNEPEMQRFVRCGTCRHYERLTPQHCGNRAESGHSKVGEGNRCDVWEPVAADNEA